MSPLVQSGNCLYDIDEEILTVPFGLRHISLSLNSFTLASSGVMVAHLTPTEYF